MKKLNHKTFMNGQTQMPGICRAWLILLAGLVLAQCFFLRENISTPADAAIQVSTHHADLKSSGYFLLSDVEDTLDENTEDAFVGTAVCYYAGVDLNALESAVWIMYRFNLWNLCGDQLFILFRNLRN